MERSESVFTGFSPVRNAEDNTQVITQGEVSPEALERIKKAEKGELRAKLAAILDRGIVEDRLKVELPEGMYGEWVRNDPLEIRRLQSLGFKIDDTYAKNRGIHSDGSDSAIVGDVIYMIVDKEVKDVIDDIRHEQIIKTHLKKKKGRAKVNKEETDFLSSVENEGYAPVSGYADSDERAVTHTELAAILANIDSQQKPSGK